MMRTKLTIFVGVAIVLFMMLAAFSWFTSIGTGEYRDSPDGVYRASADNMTRGTWTRGRESYIRIMVQENATGRVIWRIERQPPATANIPEYGNRSAQFIGWDQTSLTVSVPVEDARVLTLHVP